MNIVSSTDYLVFLIVVGLRFLLPLFIPYYPLPAIIACLLLDGVDQTIFQVFTKLPLDGYQSYDKALDIYYLTVAYIATLRNWTNLLAFRVSRFLLYYRLVGVVLFELTQLRALLLIFPNTFEYFFIWYETVRLWWNPKKLARRTVFIAAAAIWIVIKLPQEYWIHIAQRDVTDTIKALLGGTEESAWGPLITANLLPILLVIAVIAVALFLLVRYLRRATPRPDHPLALHADAHTDKPTDAQLAAARVVWLERIFDRDLFEKVVLLSLLLIIFSNIIPTIDTRPLTITLQVLVLLVYNTSVSHLLARRGTTIASGIVHLAVMWLGNFAFIFVASFVPGVRVNLFNAIFIVTLLSLLVTLYDRYRVFHLARFERKALFGRAPAAP